MARKEREPGNDIYLMAAHLDLNEERYEMLLRYEVSLPYCYALYTWLRPGSQYGRFHTDDDVSAHVYIARFYRESACFCNGVF